MKASQEMHYKEWQPEDTVKYLQGILADLGIAVEEQRIPKSGIDTCSMRVCFKGTDMGANGKGVSESYMAASAYAELLERVQNHHLNPWGWYRAQPEGFWHCPDEKMVSSLEIARAAKEQSFLSWYFAGKGLLEASDETRAEAFEKLHRIEFQLGRGKDLYEVRPYYSAKHGRVEELPYYLVLLHYASNGMCAGNSPYEALVQGFSEIIERHIQKKLMQEKPCLPDIPDTYMQKFPEVWVRMEKLRRMKGIRAYMKDGSFGGRYPAAVLLLVAENRGSYGVKLGCHPDFGIAMERTLTEATQGGEVLDYCGRSTVDFYNNRVDDPANIYNSYKFGEAQYPFQLFGENPNYPFTPVEDVAGKSNRELFEMYADGFLSHGYDILLRDVSYLGFPSYQMLIPGFSEMQTESDLLAKVCNTRAYLTPYLAYPERMDKKRAKLLLGVLEFFADSPMENQMKQIFGVYPAGEFPAEDLRKGWRYLSCMCYYLLDEYREAAAAAGDLLQTAHKYGNKEESFYLILYEYLTLRDTGKGHEESMDYLARLFDKTLCSRLAERIYPKEEVFLRQYARYDYQKQYGEELTGECALWEQIRGRLFEEYRKHLPDQEKLGVLFEKWRDREPQEKRKSVR